MYILRIKFLYLFVIYFYIFLRFVYKLIKSMNKSSGVIHFYILYFLQEYFYEVAMSKFLQIIKNNKINSLHFLLIQKVQFI